MPFKNLEAPELNQELSLQWYGPIAPALEKIANGGYGLCEKCVKKIEEARLQVAPEARLCVNCNVQLNK